MDWLVDTIGTSIGKKLLMALTGLGFCLFLAVHLAGNLTLYGGADMFNSYAEHLHSLGPLVTVAELGLLAMAAVHVLAGLLLFYENRKARPVRYKVRANAGGETLGSATMPYTGVLLLVFVIAHLMNFHFVDKTHTTIYAIVAAKFAQPMWVVLYIGAMLVAALHVSHGFWSALQTLGANHPKYFPLIRAVALIFALLVGAGFGFLPIYVGFVA